MSQCGDSGKKRMRSVRRIPGIAPRASIHRHWLGRRESATLQMYASSTPSESDTSESVTSEPRKAGGAISEMNMGEISKPAPMPKPCT